MFKRLKAIVSDIPKQAEKIADEGVDWFDKVSDDKQNKRLIICINCPSYNSKGNWCGQCGCDVVWKSGLKSQNCPENKW